eukprot:g14432.t1.1.5e17418c g14432  g14432.t1 contig9:1823127-1825962(-)
MSSQESTTFKAPSPPPSPPSSSAAAPSQSLTSTSSTQTSKRRRRMIHRHGPPDRLGWMGDSSGGFGVSDAIGNDIGDERSMRNPTAAASVGGGGADCNYSEGSLLTPRPMGSDDDDDDDDFETNSTKHQLPINEQSKGAIDLTRDDDDDDDTFYFDSVDDKDNKKQPSKSAAKSRHNSDDKDSWECRQCTLLNPHDASICKVCDTPRQSSRSSVASEKTTAEQMKSRKKLRVLDDSDSDSDDDDDGDKKPKKRKSNNAASGIDAINKKRDKGDKSTTTGKQRKTGSKGSAKESSQLWKWTQSQSTQGSTSAAAAATSSSSRARLANKFKLSTSSTQSTAADAAAKGSSEMWIDKHAPRTTKELCIAPKKIDEVKSWLVSHINSRQSKRKPHSNSSNNNNNNNNNKAMSMHTTPYDNPLGDNPPPDTKMMILIGSPGIGKSAMVKVLAREMNLEILMWNDDHVDYVDNSASFQIGCGGGAGEYLPYQSQLASFEEFLNTGGLGMDSLEVAGLDSGGGGGGKSSKSGRTSLTSEKDGEYEGSVILIEEIPNIYNAESAQAFRNIMERHIRRTNVPTVFVFSDVYEGKHKPEDLERLIPSSMLYSLLVQTLQIQAVTKAKMKKSLEAIAKEEGLGRLPTELMEELHLSSGGDLRHAILALQFRFGSGSSTGGRARAVDLDSTKASKRDVKLSTFHALGKLLYAKRKPRSQDPYSTTEKRTGISAWDDGRGPLDFVPEQVLEKTDMATSSAISFIAYHSPDFFTDIAQLSDAFDSISDAGEFMDRLGQTDGPFPMDYASSLGGRAIADANKNPAPSQFRHLSAPKVFEVMNKKRENETKMKQLRKRLSGSEKIAINDTIGSAHQFVTNSLPFMRNVIPQGERRLCV